MDTVMVDIPWNGFARSRDIAMAAESYELNVAPTTTTHTWLCTTGCTSVRRFPMFESWRSTSTTCLAEAS